MPGGVVIISQNAEDGAKSAYEINWHLSGFDTIGSSDLDSPNLSSAESIRFARTIERAEQIALKAKQRFEEEGYPCHIYLVRDGEEGIQPYDFETYRAHNEQRAGAIVVEGNPRRLSVPRQTSPDQSPPGRKRALERRWDPKMLDERGIQFLTGADGRWYWRKRDKDGRFLDNSLGGFDSEEAARANADEVYPPV